MALNAHVISLFILYLSHSNQSDFSITGNNGSYVPREKKYPDCLRKAGTRFRSSRSNVQKAVVGLVARGA